MKKNKQKSMKVPKDPSQRPIMKLYPKRKSLRKSLATSYYPIEHHIYYDGVSFRVRVRVDGQTISRSMTDKNKAVKLRDRLLKKRA
jgi:hypothetical protein